MTTTRALCDHCGLDIFRPGSDECDHRDYPGRCRICLKRIIGIYSEAGNDSETIKILLRHVSSLQRLIQALIKGIEDEP